MMRLDETFEIIDHLPVTALEVINGKPRSSRKKK